MAAAKQAAVRKGAKIIEESFMSVVFVVVVVVGV